MGQRAQDLCEFFGEATVGYLQGLRIALSDLSARGFFAPTAFSTNCRWMRVFDLL